MVVAACPVTEIFGLPFVVSAVTVTSQAAAPPVRPITVFVADPTSAVLAAVASRLMQNRSCHAA